MFDWTYPRWAWQDPKIPVVGPVSDPTKVVRVVIHYTAASNIPSDINQYMRDMQAAYTKNRGYSLGYNCAVTQAGITYEIRGFDIRCAANKEVNSSSFAVLMLVDGDDGASPHAVAAVRRIVAAVQQWAGRGVDVVGHGQVGATACPGVGLRQQIADGVFEPDGVEVNTMFVLDYAPNSTKWVRFAWDGVAVLTHVKSGHVAAIHQAAGLQPITVSKVQLEALLREPDLTKLGLNPFAGGPAADRDLSAAWLS